jgi:hypothetical protein
MNTFTPGVLSREAACPPHGRFNGFPFGSRELQVCLRRERAI